MESLNLIWHSNRPRVVGVQEPGYGRNLSGCHPDNTTIPQNCRSVVDVITLMLVLKHLDRALHSMHSGCQCCSRSWRSAAPEAPASLDSRLARTGPCNWAGRDYRACICRI